MCDSIPIAPPKLIMTNNKLINDCLLNISNNYSTIGKTKYQRIRQTKCSEPKSMHFNSLKASPHLQSLDLFKQFLFSADQYFENCSLNPMHEKEQ